MCEIRITYIFESASSLIFLITYTHSLTEISSMLNERKKKQMEMFLSKKKQKLPVKKNDFRTTIRLNFT